MGATNLAVQERPPVVRFADTCNPAIVVSSKIEAAARGAGQAFIPLTRKES
jgi:hypothetical protein